MPGRIRLLIAVFCALGLMQVDRHLGLTAPLRQGLSVLLHPVVELLQLPRDAAFAVAEALQSNSSLQAELDSLRQQQLEATAMRLRLTTLETENENLRSLQGLQASLARAGVVAEFQAAQRDPFAHRILIGKGSEQGISVGDPVISSDGVIGQVSRSHPLTAEVRLLSDEQMFVPVLLPRAGIRAIAQGMGTQDGFELQYVNLAADIRIGDQIVSSGLDGRYPAGLPVGEVVSIIPGREGQFPRVLGRPAASVAIHQQMLVLRK